MHRYKASVEQSFRLHVAERHFTERESPSVDPASCRPQCPPRHPLSSQEASKNPERVELRGILGKNLRAAFERPLGSEAPPRFVHSESSAGSSKKRSRTSVAVESGGGGVIVMASGVSG